MTDFKKKEKEYQPTVHGLMPDLNPALPAVDPPKGWQCPFCLVVHAPHITECFCQQIGTTSDRVLLTEDPDKD